MEELHSVRVCDGFSDVRHMQVSPCGMKVCVLHSTGFAVCSPQQGRELQKHEPMQVCCWTACSRFLFLGDARGTIYAWHIPSHSQVWSLDLPQAKGKGFLCMVAIPNGLLCLLENHELCVFKNIKFATIHSQFVGEDIQHDWKLDVAAFSMLLPEVREIIWNTGIECLFALSDTAVFLHDPDGNYAVADSFPLPTTPVFSAALGGLLCLVFPKEVHVMDAKHFFLVGQWMPEKDIVCAAIADPAQRSLCLFSADAQFEVRVIPSGHFIHRICETEIAMASGWFFATPDALQVIMRDEHEGSDSDSPRSANTPQELRRNLESLVEKSLSRKISLSLGDILSLAEQLLPHVPGFVGSQILRASFVSLKDTNDAICSVSEMIQGMEHIPESYDVVKGQLVITDALSRLATFQMLPGLHDIFQSQDGRLRASLSGRSKGTRIPASDLKAKQSLSTIESDTSHWNPTAWHYFRMANLPKLCVELARVDRLQEMFIIFNRHISKATEDMVMTIIEAIPSVSGEDEDLIPEWVLVHVVPLLSNGKRIIQWVFDRTRRLEASQGIHAAYTLVRVICERVPPSLYFCGAKTYNLWAGDSPWSDSALRTLYKNLSDIVWLEQEHQLSINLSNLETLPTSHLIARALDRVGAASHLEDAIRLHVEPICVRFRLDCDEELEEYIQNSVSRRQQKHGSVERTLERGVEILKYLKCEQRKALCLVHLLQLKNHRYAESLAQLVAESRHWSMPRQLRGRILSEVTLMQAYDVSISNGLCPPSHLDNFYVQRLISHLLASVNKPGSFQDALRLLEVSPLQSMARSEALFLRLNYMVRWSPTIPNLREQIEETLGTHVGEAASRFVEFCVLGLAGDDDRERMSRCCLGAIWTLQLTAHVEHGWLRSDMLALMVRVHRLQEMGLFLDPLVVRDGDLEDVFYQYGQPMMRELVDGSKAAFGRLLNLADLLGLSQGHVWQAVLKEANTRKVIPQSLLQFTLELVPKDFVLPNATKGDVVQLVRSVLRELSTQHTRNRSSLIFHLGRILDSLCYCLQYCHSIGQLVDFTADLHWSLTVLLQSDLGDAIHGENVELLPIAHGHAFSNGISSWIFPKKDLPLLLPGREIMSGIFQFLCRDGNDLLASLGDCHFLAMRLATGEAHYRELCSLALKTLFRSESRSDFILAIALFGAMNDGAKHGVALFQSTLRTIEAHDDPNEIYIITQIGRAMGHLWGDSLLTRRMQKMETSTKWSTRLGGKIISVTPNAVKLRHMLPEIVRLSNFDIDVLLEFAKDWNLDAEEVTLVWAKIFLLTPKVINGAFDFEYQVRIAPRLDHVDAEKTRSLLETALEACSPYDYERIRFIRRRLVGIEDKCLIAALEGYVRSSPPSAIELDTLAQWRQGANEEVVKVVMDLAQKRLPWTRLQSNPWDMVAEELRAWPESIPALLPVVTSMGFHPDLLYAKYLTTRCTFLPGVCAFHLEAIENIELRSETSANLMQSLLAQPMPALNIVLEVARFQTDQRDDVVLLETRVDLMGEHLTHFEPLFLATKQIKILLTALYYFLAQTSYKPYKAHNLVDRIAARHDICGKTFRCELMKEWLQMDNGEMGDIFPTVSPTILHELNECCKSESERTRLHAPTRISECFSSERCSLVHRASYIAMPKHNAEKAAALSSCVREDLKSRLTMLLQWVFHKSDSTLRHGAKVRCFQVCFAIAPIKAIQKVYNHPLEEIMEFWKCFVYMDRLERMRLPQEYNKFLKQRKDGIIRSLWRTHKDSPEGIMIICGLMVDFDSIDVRFIALVLLQVAHLRLFHFLKVFLLELHGSIATSSLPYDQELVIALRFVLLELPTQHLNKENILADEETAAVLIPIIPHVLQRCPFVGLLSEDILQCAQDLFASHSRSPLSRRDFASPCGSLPVDTIALDVAFCSPKTSNVANFLSHVYEQNVSLVLYGCFHAPDWFRRISFHHILTHKLEKELRARADPKGKRVFQEFVFYCAEKMQIECLLDHVLDNPETDLWDAMRLFQIFGQVHGLQSLEQIIHADSTAAGYLRRIVRQLAERSDPRRAEFLDILSQSVSGCNFAL